MAMSTCGGCNKTFTSLALFEKHRIGDFEEPIYGERASGKSLKIIGYTPHTRRCMTTEELLANGYLVEHKTITVLVDGRDRKEERDIWYDPIARAAARAAFRKIEEEQAEETEE